MAARQHAIVNPLPNNNLDHNEAPIQTYNRMYVSPDQIHAMFDETMDINEFTELCHTEGVCRHLQNRRFENTYITNDEYIWHIYTRYLCCAGDIDGLMDMLDFLRTHYTDNEDDLFNEDAFHLFLNRVDVPGFENTTILDMFIMWNSNLEMVIELDVMGARSHITHNIFTNYIHNSEWSNPFAGVMSIPGFPDITRNAFLVVDDVQEIIREHGDVIDNEIVIMRHGTHFQDTLFGVIQCIPNARNDQYMNLYDMMLQNNPILNNDAVLDTDIAFDFV